MIASGFSWFHLIPAVDEGTLLEPLGLHGDVYVHLHAWMAALGLLAFALIARRGLDRVTAAEGWRAWDADERPSARSIAEAIADWMRGEMNKLMPGGETKTFFPLIASLFMYIFLCNIMAIVPGLLPPTDNINANVGMAVISFLTFNIVGLTRDPVGYIKHLMGPMLALAPVLFVLEVLSLCIRPLSLTLRLTANMFGDHTVFGVMSDLVPIWFPVPWLVPLLMLAILVSAVQAFVFSILSATYIALALPHHAAADGDHH